MKYFVRFKKNNLLRKTLRISGILVVSWIVVTLLLFLFQDLLIYSPQKLSISTIRKIHTTVRNSTEVSLNSNGVVIHGWLVINDNIQSVPLIIYFGGQGDEISSVVEQSKKFTGCNFISFNYRGYGLSQGKPSEKGLFGDSLSIYDYVEKVIGFNGKNIIVMGRSLGTGVAVYLAQHRKVKAMILVSPYDSITSVASEKLPFAPVAIINRNKYDSISRITKVKCPTLAIVAEKDLMVPIWHSIKLLRKLPGEKQIKIIKNRKHDDIMGCNEYWAITNGFIKNLDNDMEN